MFIGCLSVKWNCHFSVTERKVDFLSLQDITFLSLKCYLFVTNGLIKETCWLIFCHRRKRVCQFSVTEGNVLVNFLSLMGKVCQFSVTEGKRYASFLSLKEKGVPVFCH